MTRCYISDMNPVCTCREDVDIYGRQKLWDTFYFEYSAVIDNIIFQLHVHFVIELQCIGIFRDLKQMSQYHSVCSKIFEKR